MGTPVPPRRSSGVEVEAQSLVRRLTRSPYGKTAAILIAVGVFFTLFSRSWFGLLVIMAGFGVLAVFAAPSFMAAFSWREATLELPSAGIALGSSPTLTYRRSSRRPRDVADFAVECKVVCRERVEYQRGTDTEVETATVFEQVFTGHGSGTADGLEGTVQILVPIAAGAPSFELRHNSVTWWLETSVAGAGLPSDDQRFPMTVSAALDPDVRNQVGDR